MTTFNTNFEIYFEDISPSGIVHLEKIAEWMSMGRERFFRKTCPDHLKFVKTDVNMFTVQMSISILGSSVWADKIEAIISMTKIKKISFEIHFEFLNKRSKEIVAQGVQKVAFVKQNDENFAPIPEDIKEAILLHSR
ncbi:MAG: acyl-CoA thioesterase [Candidatus Thorarchaeota archaeon]